MQSEKHRVYNLDYRRSKMKSICFRLRLEKDAELIKTYNAIPDKMEWFRECLRRTKKD